MIHSASDALTPDFAVGTSADQKQKKEKKDAMTTRVVAARFHAVTRRAAAAALVGMAVVAATALPALGQQLDSDYDGLDDGYEQRNGSDPFDQDTDNDDLGDGREVKYTGTNPVMYDTDGDGIDDGEELRFHYNTNPLKADTDDDGVNDLQEVMNDTDPLVPDAAPAPAPDPAQRPDRDADGLYDDDETDVYFTDPDAFDSDGDGVGDGEEVYNGTDPTE